MSFLYRLVMLLFFCVGLSSTIHSQIDRSQKQVTIDFGALPEVNEPDVEVEPEPYEVKNKNFNFSIPELQLPESPTLLSPNANSGFNFKSNLNTEFFGKEQPKEIDFKNKNEPPRYLSDNERILQYIEGGEFVPHFPNFDFGNFETSSDVIFLSFSDDGFILDGDAIRILINDKVLVNRIELSRHVELYKIKLEPGFNKIEVEAVDEGASKPMTMFLSVLDGNYKSLREKSYPLSIGSKSRIVIVKK